MIENTSQRPSVIHLFGVMSEGQTGYIEGMESAGQEQLLASCDLPTRGSNDPEFLKLGFTFGEPHPHDPMFRPATLPEGWRRDGSDHAMWSYIVDQLGRRRVGIFYKAAFYDRSAHMGLSSVSGYISNLAYEGGQPVLDTEWCTPAAVTEAARACIESDHETVELYTRAHVVERDGQYAAERVAEARTRISWAEALIARVSASTVDGGQ